MNRNKINNMKKIVFIFSFSLSCLFLQAQFKADKEPLITKSLSGESVKNVEARTSGGSISVSGVASEARIEVYVTTNNSRDDLSREETQQRLNERYNLDIQVTNNKLIAIAKPKDKTMDWKKALNISFRIFVPRNVGTDLSTSGGSISLDNLAGNQEFSTSGGSLHIGNVSGNINGRTSGGSIHVEDSKDDIDLSTSGGSIEARNCEGRIRLNTSGGSLDLDRLKGTIKATTSGGSINGRNVEGELNAFTSGGSIEFRDLSCSLETGTSGGNVDVSFKELGKYVKISNSGGNIELELPKNKGLDLRLSGNRVKTDHLDNFSGTVEEDQVDGKLNGGGILVKATAGSGRISLNLK
jgi:hypothetical protein